MEPQTWFSTLNQQGIPSTLSNALQRYVIDQRTGTIRAKKAAGCLFWISPTPMAQIEAALTQHGGVFDGAAGPVRSVASSRATCCRRLPALRLSSARVWTWKIESQGFSCDWSLE